MSERVLILGDDLRAFLAVVRSLGRCGLEVHAAPSDAHAPALRSRYLAGCHDLPAYAKDPAAWEAALRALIRRHGFALVVPCSDSSLVRLHVHRSALAPARLAIPNAEAFDAFTDKARTRALAARLGVPVAHGQPVAPGEDAAMLARRYGLPLLLKPRRSYCAGDSAEKRPARLIGSEAELACALAAGKAGDCLVERFVPGVCVGLSVLARGGELLLAYQHRRLRQGSATGVSTSRISERPDPRLLADAAALARAAALDGLAMFEFRCAPDGAYVLLEVNPRPWGSLPLAVAAGADFPAALHALLVHGRAPADTGYEPGRVMHDLTGDYERCVNAFESAPNLRARLRAAAGAFVAAFLRRRSRLDSWAADDPAPWEAERAELHARIVRAVLKRSPGAAPKPSPTRAPRPAAEPGG